VNINAVHPSLFYSIKKKKKKIEKIEKWFVFISLRSHFIVDVGTVLKQPFHHIKMTVAGCSDECSRLGAILHALKAVVNKRNSLIARYHTLSSILAPNWSSNFTTSRWPFADAFINGVDLRLSYSMKNDRISTANKPLRHHRYLIVDIGIVS
jgi:hypothetical protein